MLSVIVALLGVASLVLGLEPEISANSTAPLKENFPITYHFPTGTLVDRRSLYTTDPECNLQPSYVFAYRINSCIIRNSDSWKFTDVSETDGVVTFTWTQCTDTKCSTGCDSVVHEYPNCNSETGQVWDATSDTDAWTWYSEWYKYRREEFSEDPTCSGDWGYWYTTTVCDNLDYCDPNTYSGSNVYSVGSQCFEN